MTERQSFIIKTLFYYENHGKTTDGYHEVLQDAPSADVTFMRQLIENGYVCAYQARSKGCGLPCFMFAGFTPQGCTAYASYFRDLTTTLTNRH